MSWKTSEMEHHDVLTDKNWLLYAARYYDNPSCYDIQEFKEDIKRIKYIKKALTRYETTGELKERLVLNHIIILNNVFGPTVLSRILFLKMEKQLQYVKPFLVMLEILPERVLNIGKNAKTYVTDDIPMDPKIIDALRKI